MEEYLLRVAKAAEKDVAKWLDLPKAPPYVRVATLSPLSVYGYPPGSEGYLLRINEHGLVTGVEDQPQVPHDFVPWQNISYISDGTALAREQQEDQKRSGALAAAAANAETAPLRGKQR